MGEWVKTRTFRLTDETMRQMQEIQDAFAPFFGNATDTLRGVVSMFHSLLFGRGILERVAGVLQGLQRNTSCSGAPVAPGEGRTGMELSDGEKIDLPASRSAGRTGLVRVSLVESRARRAGETPSDRLERRRLLGTVRVVPARAAWDRRAFSSAWSASFLHIGPSAAGSIAHA
jgi:hypothetical protein